METAYEMNGESMMTKDAKEGGCDQCSYWRYYKDNPDDIGLCALFECDTVRTEGKDCTSKMVRYKYED